MSEQKPPFSIQDGVKTESEHIDLKVAGQDGSVVHFRIKRHSPLSKLMKAYCSRQPIKAADTPAQLEMEHEDMIEVYQQQTGGGC